MAMKMGGGGGVKSEINVTPLVDVMLVLLIIMMIVAPLLQQGVAVTLPQATNTTEKPETQDQTVLAIDSQTAASTSTRCRCRKTDLHPRASPRSSRTRPTSIVIIKADVDVEYGAVMEAMDQLRASGIEDMGLITDPKRGRRSAGRRVGTPWPSISITAPSASSRPRCRRPTRT